MAFGVVYLLIDGTNDKEYVGQTTQTFEERFKEHCWCKTSNIGRAIRKRGVENFATAILKVCETQEELNYWERRFIKSRGTRYPFGYNNSDGGEGGWERTPKSIAKMSRKGKKHSDKTKAILSLASKGKHHTEETKLKLSAESPCKRAVICVETGTIYESMTSAAKSNNINLSKISVACKNIRRTAGGYHWRFADAPVEEIIEAAKVLPSKGKTKARPVICVETGEKFESTIAAGRFHNISHKCIARACKRPDFTSCGYHWRFVESAQS